MRQCWHLVDPKGTTRLRFGELGTWLGRHCLLMVLNTKSSFGVSVTEWCMCVCALGWTSHMSVVHNDHVWSSCDATQRTGGEGEEKLSPGWFITTGEPTVTHVSTSAHWAWSQCLSISLSWVKFRPAFDTLGVFCFFCSCCWCVCTCVGPPGHQF